MLKKTCLLVTCAAISWVYASCDPKANNDGKSTAECAVTSQDLKKMGDIAKSFQELEAAFEKWGVPAVWDQVQGKNSNQYGSQENSTVYSAFADPKSPIVAVVNGKFVSADPKLNDQAAAADHVKKIQTALQGSDDGKVTVEYTRMEKNPADNDGPTIEVKIKAVAWNQKAFGMKDNGEFFVYREIRS